MDILWFEQPCCCQVLENIGLVQEGYVAHEEDTKEGQEILEEENPLQQWWTSESHMLEAPSKATPQEG